jgi:hypothetical protein
MLLLRARACRPTGQSVDTCRLPPIASPSSSCCHPRGVLETIETFGRTLLPQPFKLERCGSVVSMVGPFIVNSSNVGTAILTYGELSPPWLFAYISHPPHIPGAMAITGATTPTTGGVRALCASIGLAFPSAPLSMRDRGDLVTGVLKCRELSASIVLCVVSASCPEGVAISMRHSLDARV